ncbi:hypothetical protein [Streptomyces virginiae]|uniref:hypothetical protein n=1 Tax=Streptomyces virginiae TaxID=1961 RepID=UPI0036FB341B
MTRHLPLSSPRPYHHPYPGPVTAHYFSAGPLTAAVTHYGYAGAYRVTPPEGTPSGVQTWSGTIVRTVVGYSMKRPPVGWPHGHAEFHPDGTILFTGPLLFPWDEREVQMWRAEPVPVTTSWGPPCVRCGAFEDEHCSWCAPWLYRRDGSSCAYGSFSPVE